MSNSLSIKEEEYEGVLVLTLKGTIDARAARELDKALLECLARGRLAVLLDLTGLSSIAGAGLRVVVATAERIESRGGALALCSLRPSVNRILDMAGMDRLEIFADRTAAWNWLEVTIRRQRIARLATKLLHQEAPRSETHYAPTMVDTASLRYAVKILRTSLDTGLNKLPVQ